MAKYTYKNVVFNIDEEFRNSFEGLVMIDEVISGNRTALVQYFKKLFGDDFDKAMKTANKYKEGKYVSDQDMTNLFTGLKKQEVSNTKSNGKK